MSTTDSGAQTRPVERSPRQRTIGELIVDVIIVIGSAAYLWVAQDYPKAGREIPTVVGSIALIVGLIQLVGWFVPQLWTATHGAAPTASPEPTAPTASPEPTAPTASPEPAAAGTGQAPDSAGPVAVASTRQQTRDTVVIIAASAGFLAAILVLGYRYGVPLFFLAYFGARHQWRLAIGSAVVMWALTQFVFIDLLAITLPTSQFFTF